MSQALQLSPYLYSAVLVGDSFNSAVLFVAAYLARGLPLLALPRRLKLPVPADALAETLTGAEASASRVSPGLPAPLEALQALAVAAAICALGHAICTCFSIQDYLLPVVTLLAVSAASLLPNVLAPLAPAGEALGQLLMALFLAVVGASVPPLALFADTVRAYFLPICLQIIAVRAACAVTVGSLLRLRPYDVLRIGAANVGSRRWRAIFAAGMLAVFIIAFPRLI